MIAASDWPVGLRRRMVASSGQRGTSKVWCEREMSGEDVSDEIGKG
jgi:hypothetical protein